jgi:hypothetical protein
MVAALVLVVPDIIGQVVAVLVDMQVMVVMVEAQIIPSMVKPKQAQVAVAVEDH